MFLRLLNECPGNFLPVVFVDDGFPWTLPEFPRLLCLHSRQFPLTRVRLFRQWIALTSCTPHIFKERAWSPSPWKSVKYCSFILIGPIGHVYKIFLFVIPSGVGIVLIVLILWSRFFLSLPQMGLFTDRPARIKVFWFKFKQLMRWYHPVHPAVIIILRKNPASHILVSSRYFHWFSFISFCLQTSWKLDTAVLFADMDQIRLNLIPACMSYVIHENHHIFHTKRRFSTEYQNAQWSPRLIKAKHSSEPCWNVPLLPHWIGPSTENAAVHFLQAASGVSLFFLSLFHLMEHGALESCVPGRVFPFWSWWLLILHEATSVVIVVIYYKFKLASNPVN